MSQVICKHVFLATALSLALLTSARASSEAGTPAGDSASGQTADGNDSSGTTPAVVEGPLSRWLEVDALSFTMRYRNSFDTNGQKVFDNIQARNLVSGKLKFDKQGKYFVGFRAVSGKYFNWSFGSFSGLDYKTAAYKAFSAASPARYRQILTAYYGDPQAIAVLANLSSRGWQFYLRDLYLSATPVKGLTLEFGSIPIERGDGTEITTFDDDGYISGERVRVEKPEYVYFDEVEFTSAYLGDIFTPSLFDRYDRLEQSNYRQVLVEKHFGSRVKASMDYTWLAGTNTLHEALLAKIKETRVLDSARVELYQRVNDVQIPGYFAKAANGWAFTGSKHLAKRVTVEGGYASVDQADGVYTGSGLVAGEGFSINGDSYGIGDRFFGKANVKLVPGISLFGFYTHQINSKDTPLTFSYTRQNYNLGMEFDFKSMLKRAGVL